jgi:hypothetical protein
MEMQTITNDSLRLTRRLSFFYRFRYCGGTLILLCLFMNRNRRRVIVYGDGLILASVRADLEAKRPDILFPLLQQAGLLLMGIDPETHQALVWSGRQAPAVAAANLIGIIQQ